MQATEVRGIFREGRDLFTVNRTPGVRASGETLRTVEGVEYRLWDPFRSKLAALLLRGVPPEIFADVRSVLYLGAAHGTTVGHLADVLPEAPIFAVEKSPTSFAPLLAFARQRPNVFPLLADAQLPERYRAEVGRVDLLYQDVAQRNQAQIFVENLQACLAPGRSGILMLKIRSVTQRRPSSAVVREAKQILENASVKVRSEVPLAPFSREHVALVARG